MCLITEQKKSILTTEDMIVWKRLAPFSNISPYQEFKYIPGTLYKTRIKKCNTEPPKFADIISYKFYPELHEISWDKREDMKKLWKKSGFIMITEGFHSYATEERALRVSANRRLRKFLIPKGSLIYGDATDLIVSNKIIMLE